MDYDKLVKLFDDLTIQLQRSSQSNVTEDDALRDIVTKLRAAIFTEAATELISRPTLGSRWQHRNGNFYTVEGYSNGSGLSDKHPLTIHYRGDNGKPWSRALSQWHTSMTLVPVDRSRRSIAEGLSIGLCQARQHSDEMFCHVCSLRCDVNDADPPICGKLPGQKMRTGGAP